MGVCNRSDIFQENISKLFEGLNMVCVYINNMIVITKHNFKDHMKLVENFLQKLTGSRLKVNANKTFFRRTETEYLILWVSKEKVRDLSSKLFSIKSIEAPTKVHEACQFVEIVNYYRDIWRKRPYKLSTLTKLRSTKVKFKWTGKLHYGKK